MPLHPLDTIRVARPCAAGWEAMRGDDRVRHCAACDLHVYNLSALPAAEALALVEATEGRRCVRFYRRADGTVLTQDCPEAAAVLARERLKGALVAAAALSVWLTATPFVQTTWALTEQALRSALHAADGALDGGTPLVGGGWTAGEVEAPPVKTK
ncbi:MAG: hypothetical protein R3181_05200 [Rubricoccaceae bacterium]|nr:hypothetical protein [Rubricoccaceae bacterium]